MRFLHLADVHLDTPFAGRSPRVRERLKEASREALTAAFSCAVREGLDAVLIAGDLFHGERISFGSELFLMAELARLEEAGVRVVYATGNHDPGGAGGGARSLEWPRNVTVVGDARVQRCAIGPEGAPVGFVTAAGHATSNETADLSLAFSAPPSGLAEVALLHTQVRDARTSEEHRPYAPSDLARLVGSGYHYWALGHVHLRQCLSRAPAVHYPGNLQGRTLREQGAKGGLLVDLADPNAPTVDFRSFAPVRFLTVEITSLQEESTVARLLSRALATWEEARSSEPGAEGCQWMLRFVLAGPTPLARELDDPDERDALAREIAEGTGALDVEVWTRGTHPVLDAGEFRGRQDVLGEALRLCEEVVSGQATLPRVEASDLAGTEAGEDLEAYVRTLLADAEGTLLARLLAPDAGGE